MKKNPITNLRKLVNASLVAAPALAIPASVWGIIPSTTLPTVSGSNLADLASKSILSYQQAGATLNISITNGSTNNILTWGDFNIGSAANVTFNQTNASSAILNKVTGVSASQIDGSIISNGRVLLLNPNGITISSTAQINTSGFVASTINDTDADSVFTATNDLSYTGATAGDLTVSGAAITVNGGKGSVVLAGKNINAAATVTGNLSVNSLHTGSAITLGALTVSGDLNVKSYGAAIGSTAAIDLKGDATLSTGGNLGNGAVSLTGNVTFSNADKTQTLNVDTAGQYNLAKQAVTVNGAGNVLETVKVNGAATTLVSSGDIDLSTSSVSTLDVTSGGKLTNSGAVSATGAVGLTAATSINFQGGSDIVFSTLSSPMITVVSSGMITLPFIFPATDVSITSTGDTVVLTQGIYNTGTLTINTAKDFTLSREIGNSTGHPDKVIINSGGEFIGASNWEINATTSVAITAAGDLSFSGTVVAPKLTAISTGGSITQLAGLTVADATFNAANAITLNGANDFTTVTLQNGSTSSAVALTDINAVTVKGANTVGATTVTAGGTISLGSAATDSLVFANKLTLAGSSGIDVAGVAKNIAVSGDLVFGANINNVSLATSGSSFGTVKGTVALDATVVESTDLDLGALTVGRDLIARSTAGNITNSGVVNVTRYTYVSAGAVGAVKDITLTQNNVFGNTIIIGNDGTNTGIAGVVALKNTGATDIGASKVATSLTVTSGGAITDSGVIETPTATFTATGNYITLDAGTKFDTVTLNSAGATLSETDAITVNGTQTGALSVAAAGNVSLNNISSTNSLTVNTTGASAKTISDTTGTLNIFGSVSLVTKGGAVNILNASGANNFGGISINTASGAAAGADATFNESGVARFQTVTLGTDGSLTSTAGDGILLRDNVDSISAKNVTLTATRGWIDIKAAASAYTLTGSATYTAGTSITVGLGTTTGSIVATGAGDVSLTNAAAGYTVSGANVAISNTGATKLNNVVASGTLGVTSTGAVTQNSGKTILAAGDLTVSAAGQAVTLANSGNQFGKVSVTGASLNIKEDTTLNLKTVSLTGALTAASLDSIVNSGAVTVGAGTVTTLTAPNGISLTNAGNSFDQLLVTTTAGDVSIVDSGSNLQINGGSSIVGAASFKNTASGTISDFGVINVTGKTTFDASTVSILNPNSSYGSVVFKGGTVNFVQNGDVNLAAGSLTTGTVRVESAKGSITSTGASTYQGALSLISAKNITFVDPSMILGTLTVNAPGASDLSVLSKAANLNGQTPVNAGTGTVVAPKP